MEYSDDMKQHRTGPLRASTKPSLMADRPGRGPWATAFRILVGNKAAMLALAVLALIVLSSMLAPWYATYVSQTNPFKTNLNGSVLINGQSVPVMQPSTKGLGLGYTPIGPT